MIDKDGIINGFKNLQDQICSRLESIDGKAIFEEDPWTRPEGGGGRTRVIQNGTLLEKGGVNFSAVYGPMPETIQKALKVSAGDFLATGVSIVLHPNNPWVPIIHMNVRYFEMSHGDYWFGGGIDLTPHYVIKEKANDFHNGLKAVCDTYDATYYPKFKKWADDYFFVRHRNETRGIGGIFFDRLTDDDHHTRDTRWSFVQAVGNAFTKLYEAQLDDRNKPFTEKERDWQLIRRGRYVEFNLVWDKGTKFGLDTGGRTESILMSLPTDARWLYNHVPPLGSPEYATLDLLKKDIDWVND